MATLSMTGFGRGSAREGDFTAQVEVSSVNRKQFDCVVSFQGAGAEVEERIRSKVRSVATRGHIQVNVRLSLVKGSELSVNPDAVREKLAALEQIARLSGLENNVTLAELASFPDVMAARKFDDPEAVWAAVSPALDAALESFATMRKREGAVLRADLEARLSGMETLRSKIAALAPAVPLAYKEALKKRLAELGADLPLDDPSLMREVAIMADKCDVAEELTRLSAHIAHARALFDGEEPCGRKLDFLSQELNREANTIASKANNAEIAQIVVELKALIETFREQVQNIE